jgi:hypothetical protein
MTSEELEFEKELMLEMQKELAKITKDIEQTLKKKVISNNRKAYTPKRYNRSGQLVNNITSVTNGKESITYWKDLDYSSNSGKDISHLIPKFINEGYGEAPYDYYNSRPKQGFEEATIEEINKKYGEGTCERVD